MQPLERPHISIRTAIALMAFVAVCIGIYIATLSAPAHFVRGTTVIIDQGQSVSSIATELADQHIIRSSFILRALVKLIGGQGNVVAGLYEFDSPQNTLQIAYRIIKGDFGYVPVKVTIPEGTNSYKLTDIIHQKFPNIDQATFLGLAKNDEGYLFPDTYFLPPQAKANMIIAVLNSQYKKNIQQYQAQIVASVHSEQDIITMASILEGEVQTTADRKMVADILWRRLAQGMRLQVDSTLAYSTGKTSAELTISDLTSDSSYNTYRHSGLPPTPISNPGADSIQATLNPTPNDYLFFLSDKNGITHYAKTNAEQNRLKQQYLK